MSIEFRQDFIDIMWEHITHPSEFGDTFFDEVWAFCAWDGI